MRQLFVFVEEPSSAVFVRHLGRSFAVEDRLRVLEHQGAGDLEKSLATKIKVICHEKNRIIVLRDQDNYDCIDLKQKILRILPNSIHNITKVRIACRELEAWYIAQPEALKLARVLKSDLPNALLKRDPDSIIDPKQEVRSRSHKRGQIWLADAIVPHLNLNSIKSTSFKNFLCTFKDGADWLRL